MRTPYYNHIITILKPYYNHISLLFRAVKFHQILQAFQPFRRASRSPALWRHRHAGPKHLFFVTGKPCSYGHLSVISTYQNIWVNYNISQTWIKAIWGSLPLLTMIPARSQWGRYNLLKYMYRKYSILNYFRLFYNIVLIKYNPIHNQL